MIKKIASHLTTFLIALVGLLGGSYWAYISNWEPESVILTIVSLLEILSYIILKSIGDDIHQDGKNQLQAQIPTTNIKNEQHVNVKVQIPEQGALKDQFTAFKKIDNRESRLELLKPKIKVLFIDDKDFNVVKILKNSGWKQTKITTDIKSIDLPTVKDSDICFVDINGVGKLLSLEGEGLDLALMLKQRYPKKKVIIYSANKSFNPFHPAWNECDFKLEKNALPYQFQSLVEEFSLELFDEKIR